MRKFRKGADVTWAWGAHRGGGKVAETFTHDVTRTLNGTRASLEEPAYLIRQADGNLS